jgi:imidazolonepropionase-like amidohydrolase
MWTADAKLINFAVDSLSRKYGPSDAEHRLGLKATCHAYGGESMASYTNAGVDAPHHLLELDQDGIKVLLQKKLPYVTT